MADMIVRPSTKLVKPFYLLALVLAIAIEAFTRYNGNDNIRWAFIIPGLMILFTALRHFELMFTKMTVTAGKLRYETGMLAKSTRTIEIHKVQDVRVDQSLGQRIFGMGNISIETAGEASRLTMINVDRPQAIADQILEAAHT